MTRDELKEFLDFKANEFNSPSFILTDPIQIPHSYANKEDIEIIGFIVATIAWGNRKMIIRNGEKLKTLFGESPYDFVMEARNSLLENIDFTHRTFNSEDLRNFILSLRNIYLDEGGIEGVFEKVQNQPMKEKIIYFNKVFTSKFESSRSHKHVANPAKGSAAKRINMYLRWMCRKDQNNVDFGLWNVIPSSELHLPLDVHSGRIARKLGLLHRNQNDWKAVEELQFSLVDLDPIDPCKYDYALFGLGAFENF
ncbi:MAG: TIGR02757 family protein [Crocinitomicaceae bacterium]